MQSEVHKYVDTCSVCQRMKVPRHRPYGELMPLPPPEGPWQSIAMDFIVGLPPSKHREQVFDSVLVVVDRHSKMVRLIPCDKGITAQGLGIVLLDEVFSRFGVPKSIVSDRGSLFTSKYWETMCYYLTIKRKLSTAFHPQTDGQTERLNQVLECYLRCYLNDEQNNWAELLSGAEWTINNSKNSTIGAVPFQVVYSYKPETGKNLGKLPPDSGGKAPLSIHEKAEQNAKEIAAVRERLQASWAEAQEGYKSNYNKHHKAIEFAVGDLVLLSTKNLKMQRPSKKLADKYIGPFKVLKRIGKNAYQLELPKQYGRIHSTFHVSLLQAYHHRPGEVEADPSLSALPEVVEEQDFIVEKVLNARGKGAKRRWLIKWAGWSDEHNTWEPKKNLKGAGVQQWVREFDGDQREVHTKE